MQDPKENQKVKVTGNSCNHSYRVGATYVVRAVDPNDQTARLADKMGRTRDWIGWCDMAPAVAIGWDFLKKHLPTESVDLLSCFNGLDSLELSEECQSRILLSLPNLREEIMKTAGEMDDLADEEPRETPHRKHRLP